MVMTLLQRMHQQQIEADAISYTSALSAGSISGRWQFAMHLFHSMSLRKLQPDQQCITSVINACAKGIAWQMALKLLMQSDRLLRDIVMYNATIHAMQKVAQWLSSMRLFDEISKSKLLPTAATHSSLIRSIEKSTEWQWALKHFSSFATEEFNQSNIIVFNSILGTLSASSQWQLALDFYHNFHAATLRPDVVSLNSVLNSLKISTQWQRAADLTRKARSLDLIGSYALVQAFQAVHQREAEAVAEGQSQSQRKKGIGHVAAIGNINGMEQMISFKTVSTSSLFLTALREANDPRAWEQLKILRSLTDALDLGYLKRATEKKGADNFNGGRIWRDSLPNMDGKGKLS
eukprot:symbB.v1.2.038739.t1/scaffold6151.1/size20538/2